MPERKIVVIGAGIVGASIAYYLAGRGARVVVLEASAPASGATGKSFGWINATFSKRPRAYFDLSMSAIAAWRKLGIAAQWSGSVTWFPPGPEAVELREQAANHQSWGYPVRWIEPGGIRDLLPNVTPGEVGAACLCEAEGAVNPARAANELLERARQSGAELRAPCRAIAIEPGMVRTTEGGIEADTVVLSCGVDLPQLAATAGIRAPLKDSPGVLIHTAPAPPLIDRIVVAPGAHFRQRDDGRILAGGQIVAGVGTADAQRAGAEHIREHAARYLPQLRDLAIEQVTEGHRVMPEDEYPIIGPAAGDGGRVYLAAMHSGVTLAPLIGELAAREILDREPVRLLDPYRPSRFD